jgi:hypothetical protein
MRCRPPIVLVLAVSGAAFALLAAGCGGGKPLGVASVTSPTTTTATTTQSVPGSGSKSFGGGGGGGGPASHAHFQIAMNVGNATAGAKFSSCMRKHGVSSFPDPNAQGVITFGSSTGIDPNSPTFQSAQTTCQKLLPNGGQPTPQQKAQMQQQLLALSTCMRDHGIKDFPDPSNGGIHLNGGPGSDLDPNNAQFRAAQQACRGDLPFKAGGARAGVK